MVLGTYCHHRPLRRGHRPGSLARAHPKLGLQPSEDASQGKLTPHTLPRAAPPCSALPPPRAGGAQPSGLKAPPRPAAQICLERPVSAQGSVGHHRRCGELGSQSSALALWGRPVPRDARPVLGPAALLCLSVPWASSLVQHGRPRRVAGRPGVSLAQGGMRAPQVLWCSWNPKVWLGRVGEGGPRGVQAERPLTCHPQVYTPQTCHFPWGPPGGGADKVKAPLVLVFGGDPRAQSRKVGSPASSPWWQVRSTLDPRGTVGGTEGLAAARGQQTHGLQKRMSPRQVCTRQWVAATHWPAPRL